MIDIQKCTAVAEVNGVNRTCQVCNKCYRFTAPQGYNQAWGAPAPDFDPEKGCENFLHKPFRTYQDDFHNIKSRKQGGCL